MERFTDYQTARRILLEQAVPVQTEVVPLTGSRGRILAGDVFAANSIPGFERSPYDGYAFRAADTEGISEENPVTLKILEEIPAGSVPTKTVTPGTAVKILTGAPLPDGADAVIPFERTQFTAETVTLFAPVKQGDNVVRIGEDVDKGSLIAHKGSVIDLGVAASLSSQGMTEVEVFRRPVIGLISTGSEVTEPGCELQKGKIYNSNRFSIQFALEDAGCQVKYLGLVRDTLEKIEEKMLEGLADCDAVVLTGGVSVGDYDLTPAAMEGIGADISVRGVTIKPGMACAFAQKDGKPLYGLSGNPASSITSFYLLVLPALKKMCGCAACLPDEMELTLAVDFGKRSKATRLLRGILDLSDGTARIWPAARQGNVAISSMIGCNVMGIIPAGSGEVKAGTKLKGFLL